MPPVNACLRRAEGRTTKEIRRPLKRYIAQQVYRRLNDQNPLDRCPGTPIVRRRLVGLRVRRLCHRRLLASDRRMKVQHRRRYRRGDPDRRRRRSRADQERSRLRKARGNQPHPGQSHLVGRPHHTQAPRLNASHQPRRRSGRANPVRGADDMPPPRTREITWTDTPS